MEQSKNQFTSLNGKTALVTGGTKGIGWAIADKLAQEGAQVIVTARNNSDDANLAHHFIAADLTKPADTARLAREILENSAMSIY